MFDAEDFSIPDPLLFKKNIVTAIEKEGYRGRIRINGYFGPKITIPQDLLDQYLEAGIYSKIFEGVLRFTYPSFLTIFLSLCFSSFLCIYMLILLFQGTELLE